MGNPVAYRCAVFLVAGLITSTMPRSLSIVFAVVLLSACASPLKNWDPNAYTVKSGDTLYSIAWRYEIDPVELAEWNGLKNMSLIHPGQRLRTRAPEVTADDRRKDTQQTSSTAPTVRQAARYIVVKKNDTLYALARTHKVPAKQLIRANNLRQPYRLYPGQQLKLDGVASTRTASTAKGRTSAALPDKKLSWQWPVRGKIIKRFNKKRLDAKGIDIAVAKGSRIKAAAPGKVVYSGNGLISYGNLVIIKHNNTYLSAYANNEKLLVREGEHVKQGQVIAEPGGSGLKNPHLHFEIRRKGKPVNPVSYLPRS